MPRRPESQARDKVTPSSSSVHFRIAIRDRGEPWQLAGCKLYVAGRGFADGELLRVEIQGHSLTTKNHLLTLFDSVYLGACTAHGSVGRSSSLSFLAPV